MWSVGGVNDRRPSRDRPLRCALIWIGGRSLGVEPRFDPIEIRQYRALLERRHGTLAVVSFDVFFQGFRSGEASLGGGDAMRQVLATHVVWSDPDNGHLLVEFGDGSVDVSLEDDGMMANHVTGVDPWDLLVRGAQAAGWVIMPVGCPVCLTNIHQEVDLPEELRGAVVVVRSGSDLLQVIDSA